MFAKILFRVSLAMACSLVIFVAFLNIQASSNTFEDGSYVTDFVEYAKNVPTPDVLDELADIELGDAPTDLPFGVASPTIVDLFPHAAGASVIRNEDGVLLLRADTQNPKVSQAIYDLNAGTASTDREVGATLVFEEGDVAIAVLLYRQCSWVSEYIAQRKLGNETRSEIAIEKLKEFSTLPVVLEYDAEIAAGYRDDIIPALLSEDGVRFGEYWLSTSCAVVGRN